jgi:hypothetical protein
MGGRVAAYRGDGFSLGSGCRCCLTRGKPRNPKNVRLHNRSVRRNRCVLARCLFGGSGFWRHDQSSFQSCNLRGRTSRRSGPVDPSATAAAAGIAVDPAATDARFDLVRVLCEAGEYESCWRESERALPWVNEAELHLLRVRALEAMGRDSAAANELAAARRTFPWAKDLRTEQAFLFSNNF